MTTLNNSAEGGTNGTTVTVANSDATSGTAWDTVTIGSGGAALTYDNTHTYGTLAYKCVSGTSITSLAWSTSLGTLGEAWGRVYLYMDSLPSSISAGLLRITNGSSQVARLTISGTGNIELRNAANTKLGQTVTGVAIGQWVRVEWHCVPLATNGTIEVRLFNSADSITADESTGFTNAALLTNLTQVQHGPVNNVASGTYWLDNLIVTTLDWAGPVVQPVTPAGVTSGETFGTATLTPGPVTVSPSGVASGQAFGVDALSLNVLPGGIASSEALGTPAVAPGLWTVAPGGITSGEAFGTATISRGFGVLPSGIPSAEAFGSTTLVYSQAVAPTGIGSAETFGVPVVNIPWLIAPQGIDSAEAFGLANLVQWVLHPPVIKEGPVADGPLFSRYKLYRGISIIQDADGSWRTARYPAQTELETALRVYMGGRMYPLTSDDRAMLISAGFGDYIEEI
jgi:hypothetical protein